MKYTGRRLPAAASCLVLALFPQGRVFGQETMDQDLPTVTFGIFLDGESERYDAFRESVEEQIGELLSTDFDVRFPPSKRIAADWTQVGVGAALDALLADPDVDIVLALGVQASSALCCWTELSKPVIAPFVIDAEIQDFPDSAGASGVPNLSYIAYPSIVERDVRAFQEIVAFGRLTMLANLSVVEAIPGANERTLEALRGLGIEAEFVAVGGDSDVASILKSIPEDAQAVYLFPLTQLSLQQVEELAAGLAERRVPSFSFIGESEVQMGILAGRTPDSGYLRLARRIALYAKRILEGEEAGTLPTAFALGEKLTINMATARAIPIFPPWSALTEAELIDSERRAVERMLNLAEVAQEAVLVNLDLKARDRAVAAGAQDTRIARARLLPQLDAGAQGTIIDEDRAAASFGAQPERSFGVAAGLRQVIVSEPVWASVSIEKSLQQARVQDYEALRLDIILAATETYLNVLGAKTAERIERENLRVTRSNLDLARVRRSIGSAGPGEVYRWESEIAANRQRVIDASAFRNQVEIALNQLLNRPLEESFGTREIGLDDPSVVPGGERLTPYFGNPWSFRVLRSFMAREALVISPDLKVLQSFIGAQERKLTSTTNSFWVPAIVLEGSVGQRLGSAGAGTQSGIPGLPDVGDPIGFTQPDDTQWGITLAASLPLFTGGSRIAERAQAAEDLSRLRLDLDAASQRVEQGVRSALHAAGASFANISLSRDRAEASRSNFELVTDSYARGALSIIELLDAQNSYLRAELAAANAVYVFLIDLMNVERAVGRSSFFATSEELDDFFDRLERFYVQADPLGQAP
jgi:outer membrane protein TolC